VRKVQIIPRTTAKDLVKMLKETGRKVSMSTVKRVLYRHNLKGRSARKKPLLQNRSKIARLRFATAHGDKDQTFWRNVLWSDKTKIELFGHNDHRYVWREKGEACKLKNTIPTLNHGVAASFCGGALLQEGLVHFTKGMKSMMKDNDVDILKPHLKTSVRKLRLGHKWVYKWTMTPSILPKLWQNGLRTTKSRYWSGHHKALTSIP
jgi:hypothetical protein